jgi:hypothetical protein
MRLIDRVLTYLAVAVPASTVVAGGRAGAG